MPSVNRLLSEIGRTQRLSIVRELKRSKGLAVKEIARRLGMSYMGIKQHCIELAREGYLDTWRNPKPMGRPEMLYRLTRKANDLFPTDSNALTLAILEAARQMFGPSTPLKLLFVYFRDKTEGYAAKLHGETPEARARWLSRLRDREGCISEVVNGEVLQIIERHSPIRDLLEAYPEAANMERELFERVLGARVARRCEASGGLYECVFTIG